MKKATFGDQNKQKSYGMKAVISRGTGRYFVLFILLIARISLLRFKAIRWREIYNKLCRSSGIAKIGNVAEKV